LVYNTEAIVIRSLAYGETHAIVTLLTPSGTVGAMARGAKRPQSRLGAGVQLCVEGIYTLSQRSGLANIQQVEILNARRPLREDLWLAAYAAYFCELVSLAAEERPAGSEAVYRSFRGALDRLGHASTNSALVARTWEAKVLQWLGAAPDWERCARCGDELRGPVWYSAGEGGLVCERCHRAAEGGSATGLRVPESLPRILAAMAQTPWERLGRLAVSESTGQVLNLVLRTQLEEYAGVRLKSRKVLDHLTMK
jgi:DNA repair protein RecO (recombination protein O)